MSSKKIPIGKDGYKNYLVTDIPSLFLSVNYLDGHCNALQYCISN